MTLLVQQLADLVLDCRTAADMTVSWQLGNNTWPVADFSKCMMSVLPTLAVLHAIAGSGSCYKTAEQSLI